MPEPDELCQHKDFKELPNPDWERCADCGFTRPKRFVVPPEKEVPPILRCRHTSESCTAACLVKMALYRAWDSQSRRMDWQGLEATLVMILRATDMSRPDRLSAIKEAIDAYTKRGHFQKEEYFTKF